MGGNELVVLVLLLVEGFVWVVDEELYFNLLLLGCCSLFDFVFDLWFIL